MASPRNDISDPALDRRHWMLRGLAGPCGAEPARAFGALGARRYEAGAEGHELHPVFSRRRAFSARPVGHEAAGAGGSARRVSADRDDCAGNRGLRALAILGPTNAPRGPGPLGTPHDRRPQRRRLLRAHWSRAAARRAIGRPRRAGQFSAVRRGLGEAATVEAHAATVRAIARRYVQQRLRPARPTSWFPWRSLRPVRHRRPKRARLSRARPVAGGRDAGRALEQRQALRALLDRDSRKPARDATTAEFASHYERASNCCRATRRGMRSLSTTSRKASASGTACRIASIDRSKRGNSAACPTSGSACSWPGG